LSTYGSPRDSAPAKLLFSSQNKVVQLRGDSAAFDFSPFVGTVDFVFIDGAHFH
jgi:hypothetical protein